MRRSGRPSFPTSSKLSWWTCATLAIVAACSPFGSSNGGLDPGTGATDGGDAGALVEAGSELDSGDGSDSRADADASGADCSSDVVVVGTDVKGADFDRIPVGSVDAYGFAAAAGIAVVTARCAKLYVANLAELDDGEIAFGVYSDGGVKPGTRIAVARFSGVQVGWNAAKLEPPVVVGPTQTFWLALTPTKGAFSVLANALCGLNQNSRMTRSGLAPGDLPNPFNHNGDGPQCGATLFLAP